MSTDGCDLLCLDLEKGETIRSSLPTVATIEPAAQRLKALSDPTRLQIALALSATDELCVCDLAWIVGRAENLVSHHVRVLKTSGLATSRRDGKMVMYALTPAARPLLATLEEATA